MSYFTDVLSEDRLFLRKDNSDEMAVYLRAVIASSPYYMGGDFVIEKTQDPATILVKTENGQHTMVTNQVDVFNRMVETGRSGPHSFTHGTLDDLLKELFADTLGVPVSVVPGDLYTVVVTGDADNPVKQAVVTISDDFVFLAPGQLTMTVVGPVALPEPFLINRSPTRALTATELSIERCIGERVLEPYDTTGMRYSYPDGVVVDYNEQTGLLTVDGNVHEPVELCFKIHDDLVPTPAQFEGASIWGAYQADPVVKGTPAAFVFLDTGCIEQREWSLMFTGVGQARFRVTRNTPALQGD